MHSLGHDPRIADALATLQGALHKCAAEASSVAAFMYCGSDLSMGMEKLSSTGMSRVRCAEDISSAAVAYWHRGVVESERTIDRGAAAEGVRRDCRAGRRHRRFAVWPVRRVRLTDIGIGRVASR